MEALQRLSQPLIEKGEQSRTVCELDQFELFSDNAEKSDKSSPALTNARQGIFVEQLFLCINEFA